MFDFQNANRIITPMSSLDKLVSYMECSEDLLSDLDLLIREIYLPLLSSSSGPKPAVPKAAGEQERELRGAMGIGRPEAAQGNLIADRMNELLHKILSSVDIAYGQTQGALMLPMPNIDLLIGLMHPSAGEEVPSPEG